MENDDIDQAVIDQVEKIVIDYLAVKQEGTVEEIYKTCRNNIPFYLLKDVVFQMFKHYKLRRVIVKGVGARYRITAYYPAFGYAYKPKRKPRPKTEPKEIKALSTSDSCKYKSQVYTFDQLLRNVRNSE